MNFYLVDDDITTRTMLKEIIEDHELGIVIDQAEDGSLLNQDSFTLKKADILLIDLLMPNKDGIETVSDINRFFQGKVVMISQVVSKNMISLAYSKGIEYYITKPLNKLEIVSVLKKVTEKIELENSIRNIHQLTQIVPSNHLNHSSSLESSFSESALSTLAQIGIIGENGYKDILDVLNYIFNYEKEHSLNNGLPPIKDILTITLQNSAIDTSSKDLLNREVKSAEQRIRRAIDQSLNHLASLGLTDYLNPTFEKYASRLFNFSLVRERMDELKSNNTDQVSNVQVNSRKFLQSLYFEIKY